MRVWIEEVAKSSKVRCRGMGRALKESGTSISRASELSGLARNTVARIVKGEPVQRQGAERLIHVLLSAGVIEADSVDLKQIDAASNVTPLQGGWPRQLPNEDDGDAGPELKLSTLRRQLSALAPELMDLMAEIEQDENALSKREQLFLIQALQPFVSAHETLSYLLKKI